MQATYLNRLSTVALAVAGTVFLATAAGADRTPRPAGADLTPESLPGLLALIRPHDNEWRHLKVRWITDVVAARKKAAREDKPMVVLYTGGAGYNEPLGVC